MKLTKKHMTKFDFIAKKIFLFTVLGLVLTIAFVLPLKSSLDTRCEELTQEVQTLENNKTVLVRDLEEIDNPTTVMKNED
ncbi:MAG: hypothetical protein IJV94_02530 [Bacilli bacterium]|nr:hypothetical protein [Bacilli bacterium]